MQDSTCYQNRRSEYNQILILENINMVAYPQNKIMVLLRKGIFTK